MPLREVRVVLRLELPGEGEAEAGARALSADDWSDERSSVAARAEARVLVVEVSCRGPSAPARARSLVEDLLRALEAIEGAKSLNRP